MLESVPWRMILWATAGLVAIFFLGWEAFGPHRKARNLLTNCMSGLAAAAAFNLVGSIIGTGMKINLALLVGSTLLGMPGAGLVGVLQWLLP